MRPFSNWRLPIVWSLTAVLSATTALAVIPEENPYSVITNRNAFGIRPPPEPEVPVVAPPPSAPPNIFLTGVYHRDGQKKAYFVINRPGSKQPDYETAGEGEEFQDFKVLEINAREGRVRALVSGREVSLNFADNGMKAMSGPAVPGTPNLPRTAGGAMPQPIAPVPLPTASAGPVVIGRGGRNLNESQPNYAAPPAYNPGNNFAEVNSAVAGAGGAAQPIQRTLPTRPGTDSSVNNPVPDQVQPVPTGMDPNSRSGIPIPIPPSRYQ